MYLNLIIFGALMISAAISDIFTMTIPNRLCALLAVSFFPAALLAQLPPAVLAAHLVSGLMVLAGTFLLFQFGWLGGGDAKLAAAATMWLGWSGLPVFLLQTGIWGGALCALLLLLRSLRPSLSLLRPAFIARLAEPSAGVPYGVAIAVGGLLAFPHSDLWRLSGGA